MEKTVEEAIKEHLRANAFVSDPDNLHFVDRFYEQTKAAEWGAGWRINSVWNDAKDKPRQNAWFIAQIGEDSFDTFICAMDKNEHWDNWAKGINMKRWAYIDDLLPERKEVQNERRGD